LEAQLAELGLTQAQSGTRTDSDGVIIVEGNATRSTNVYDSYLADNYESAYARRLLGFKSATYRMPSSYFNLRYGGDYMYVTAYDPAIYNVMVSGDQVWVEPRYITSMFGTWGATNATMLVHSPWYYGWNSVVYNPWYYSSWGYPRYSWYDWNWNICYGSGWGLNLWWGWGGIYRPWRPYHYHHHHHIGGLHYHHGHILGGGGGYINNYYGSRHNAPRNNYGPVQSSRNIVNRGSGYSTPYRSTSYRSPNSGKVYGGETSTSRGKVTTPAQGSVGRSQGVNRYTGTSRSKSYTQPSTQQSRPNNNSNITRNNSTSRSSYSSGSSFGSSSSTRGGGSSFSGGGFSGGSGGSRGGGSRGR
jgi:uncharacterized membrane protein YgcG